MPLRDPGSDTTEPDITIEGVQLSFGQSMALRVAATDFLMQMDDPETAGALGKHLTQGYRDRLSEILKLMINDRSK